MSEEEGLEPTATGTEESGTELTYEELLSKYERQASELAKTRREAASRRVTGKEKDAELEEFRNWKESQRSESDRLAERAERAESELAALKYQRLQTEVAQEAGLDLDLADRIRGDSRDSMLKDAKDLAERAGRRQNSDLDPYAGHRGGPVKAKTTGDKNSDAFNAWLQNQI